MRCTLHDIVYACIYCSGVGLPCHCHKLVPSRAHLHSSCAYTWPLLCWEVLHIGLQGCKMFTPLAMRQGSVGVANQHVETAIDKASGKLTMLYQVLTCRNSGFWSYETRDCVPCSRPQSEPYYEEQPIRCGMISCSVPP